LRPLRPALCRVLRLFRRLLCRRLRYRSSCPCSPAASSLSRPPAPQVHGTGRDGRTRRHQAQPPPHPPLLSHCALALHAPRAPPHRPLLPPALLTGSRRSRPAAGGAAPDAAAAAAAQAAPRPIRAAPRLGPLTPSPCAPHLSLRPLPPCVLPSAAAAAAANAPAAAATGRQDAECASRGRHGGRRGGANTPAGPPRGWTTRTDRAQGHRVPAAGPWGMGNGSRTPGAPGSRLVRCRWLVCMWPTMHAGPCSCPSHAAEEDECRSRNPPAACYTQYKHAMGDSPAPLGAPMHISNNQLRQR